MTKYLDLKELLSSILSKEDSLTRYFGIALGVVRDHKCKAVLEMLRENHMENLQVVQNIDIEDFGADEWIKCAPDIELDSLLPVEELTTNSSIEDVSQHIIDFETGLRDCYAAISKEIISNNERELFESLVKFKERQIFEIKSCLSI